MSDENISKSNAHKLDEIMRLIKGEENAPGVLGRISNIEGVVFGSHGKEGLATKVNLMYKVYVWVLCTLSGIVGYLLREWISKPKP